MGANAIRIPQHSTLPAFGDTRAGALRALVGFALLAPVAFAPLFLAIAFHHLVERRRAGTRVGPAPAHLFIVIVQAGQALVLGDDRIVEARKNAPIVRHARGVHAAAPGLLERARVVIAVIIE